MSNNWFKLTNPTIHQNEFIELTAFPKKGGVPLIVYVQNESDFKTFVETHRENFNIFYSVGLSDGSGRKKSNIIGANLIVLDFDFKGFVKPPLKGFINELQERLPLFIYQVVDSGHGYHIYVAIEHTTDIDRWNSVTKQLVEIFGADEKAALSTQIIRAPGSLNWKDTDHPLSVNAVFSNNCKRYSLSKLERLIEQSKKPLKYGKYVDQKPCISNMLKGVEKGYRNFAMGRLIYDFKIKGYSKDETFKFLNEWNKKNEPPKPDSEFKVEFENYWNYEKCMGSCFLSNQTLQAKLQHFCESDCPIKNGVAIQRKKYKTIDIPVNFCNPTSLQLLSGNELAILILIYSKKELQLLELKHLTKYNENTLSKQIKRLTKFGYIRREGNRIFSNTPKVYKNVLHVSNEHLINALQKELSGNEFKVYVSILWHNFFHQKPTIQAISNSLNMSKSNVSPIVKNLLKKGVIYNNDTSIGLTNIYKLYA